MFQTKWKTPKCYQTILQEKRRNLLAKPTEALFPGSGSREVWLWIMVRDVQCCWSDDGWREAMSQETQIVWKETWYKKRDSSPKPQKWCGPAEILIPTGGFCWTLTLQNSKAINICCFKLLCGNLLQKQTETSTMDLNFLSHM